MFDEQLIVVTGKGGVGKTLLASAIATLSARTVPTVLVTLDTQDAPHPIFEVTLRYEPVPVHAGLHVCRLDGLSAIREYAGRKLPFASFYEPLLKSRMFRDFAEAAPGFQELMSLGKIYDLVTTGPFQRVVVDAPATGHLKTLLDVPAATLAAVHVGPLNHNARKIQDLLYDPDRTRVVLAALPEEMAVQELLELQAYCAQRRMKSGPAIVNQWVGARFLPEEIAALEGQCGSEALRLGARAAIAEFELAGVQAQAVAPLSEPLPDSHRVMPVLRVPRFPSHHPRTLLDLMTSALEAGTPSSG